ncbi:MAG: Flp family type IVb pilin [Alphaproteobacteria bacterium]|nr:Flp family type IVb pilin [Alphaproteobacteria bacterium]
MPKARIQKNLSELWRCSKGVTAIEYALIAGTVAAVLIFSVATVSKHLDNSLRQTSTELSGMPGTGGGGGSSDGDGGSDNTGNDGGSDGGSNNDDGDDGNTSKGKGKKGR